MPEQVYTLVLPDGREVDVQSDHEPTKDEAIKIMRSMGVEPEGGSTLDAVKSFFAEPEVKAAGARLVGGMGGAMTGAVRGGPVGGIVGGLVGAALAEPIAQTITPRQEGIAETVTNIGLAGIQPKRSVGTLLQRIGREAAIGGGLGAAQATVVPVIDEGRLPTQNELLMGGGMGAGIGGLLGGALPGPKEAPKATPITDQLGNASTKNTTTEANQAANAIAMEPPKPATPPAVPAQPLVPQAGAPKEFDFQRDARLFQAGSAAAKEAEASLAFESGKKVAKAAIPEEIAQEIAASEDPIAAAFEAGRKSAIGAEDAVRAERQGEKVVEDLTFEAGREGALAAETKLKQEAGRNQAVKYIGDQELGEGQFMSLYNLTEDIVDDAGNVLHPANSTVSAQTLEKYGIPVPETTTPVAQVAKTPGDEMREIMLKAQEEAGWDPKWPFVPQDFANRTFVEGIFADSTISAKDKLRMLSAAQKLGVVVPSPEAPKPPVESVLRPSGEVGATPASPEPQMPVKGKETPLPAVQEAKPAAQAKTEAEKLAETRAYLKGEQDRYNAAARALEAHPKAGEIIPLFDKANELAETARSLRDHPLDYPPARRAAATRAATKARDAAEKAYKDAGFGVKDFYDVWGSYSMAEPPKIKAAAETKAPRRASVSDEAAIEAEAARQAGTRALQAGITGNPATAAVAGGAIGYATGDTPEERIERAGYGALAGLGVGAAATRAATRASVRPTAPARPASRAEAMKDFAPQMPKYEAPPSATAKLGPPTLFNKAPDATVPPGSAATPPPTAATQATGQAATQAASGTSTKGAAAETVSEKWLNENRPIRNFDKRIIDNPDVPQEMRDALASNPDIHYEIAHHKQTARAAAGSTDAELEMMVKSGDLAERTAALNEQSNRAAAKGDMAESARLHNLASQNLTPAAQQVSLARFLWSPWADLAEVEGAVVKTGRNLTEEQRKRVVELSINKIEAEKALAEIERLAKESFTDENIKKLRLAKVDAALARKAYDEYAIGLEPKFLGDILSKAIQGNLLTPLSLVANVFGNMFWLPVRKLGGAAGSLIDLAYSKSTGDPRSIMQGNPFPSMAELKAALEGAKVAGKELLTGPSVESYAKSEVNRGFQPIRSLLQGITGKDLPVGKDGQVLKWDRTKSIIEGLVGGPPEVFFRLLNLGDKPFRRAAEVEAAREFANLKGLKGRDLEYFLTFPTKKGARELDEMARRATFTQENKLISQLNKFLDADAIKKDLPAAAGAIKAFNRMVVPFRQFPVNYVQSAINFVSPEIALAKAIYYSAAKNHRKARIAAGEAMVGAAIYSAAEHLWRAGIISEPTSKDAKTRSAQYDRMGPQKFNISGLERNLNGEDGTYRTGDKLVDWGKMGIPAAVFYLTTQSNSEKLLEEAGAGKVPHKPKLADPLTRRMEDPASVIQSFPGLLSFSLDQSFLAGASSLLEAWKDPDPDSGKFQVWAANMFRAVTSMAIPNTAEAVARARMEFVPELKGDTNLETFKNIFKFKMNMMDPEDRPLLKRDLWGEPIRRAPKDSSGAWAQQMFDVVKYGRTEVDPFKDKLMSVYNQTEKPDVYPTPPTRVVSFGGSTVKLLPNHYEQLQETVGRMRRQVAEKVVNTAGFNRLSAMEKVYVLERVYSEAGSAATTQFLTRRDILDEYFPMFTGKGRQSENERTRRMDTKSVIAERAMNR